MQNLLTLLEGYEGTEWDGQNHKGIWSAESQELLESVEQQLSNSVTYYWDAGEWFEPVQAKLIEELRQGKTPKEIVDEQDLGDVYNGRVRRQDAVRYLESLAEEYLEEEEEGSN